MAKEQKLMEKGKINERMAAWKEVATILDKKYKEEKGWLEEKHKRYRKEAKEQIMATENVEERENVKRMYGYGTVKISLL